MKKCGGGGGGAIFEPKTLSMYLKKKKKKEGRAGRGSGGGVGLVGGVRVDVNAILGVGGDVGYGGHEPRIEGIIQCRKSLKGIVQY